MNREMVFDKEQAQLFNRCRKEAFDKVFPYMVEEQPIKNALDAGCGIGVFSDYLHGLGLEVTGFDVRTVNIQEARSRYPNIDFHVHSVEDPMVKELGSFDLTLCLGLLYHLENPFLAIRNLQAITRKILIVESMVTPTSKPVSMLVDDGISDDQSVHCVAFVPSEACIVKMLYRSGFEAVYRLRHLPDHDDFKKTITHRRRTVIVASRQQLNLPFLHPLAEREEPAPKSRDRRVLTPVDKRRIRALSRLRLIRNRVKQLHPTKFRKPMR